MKTRTITELQCNLKRIIEESQKHDILLTRHGVPFAYIIGCKGRNMDSFVKGFRHALQKEIKNEDKKNS
jgi:prevent-host-death family protein